MTNGEQTLYVLNTGSNLSEISFTGLLIEKENSDEKGFYND